MLTMNSRRPQWGSLLAVIRVINLSSTIKSRSFDNAPQLKKVLGKHRAIAAPGPLFQPVRARFPCLLKFIRHYNSTIMEGCYLALPRGGALNERVRAPISSPDLFGLGATVRSGWAEDRFVSQRLVLENGELAFSVD